MKILILTITACAALALAGCGGDSSSGSTAAAGSIGTETTAAESSLGIENVGTLKGPEPKVAAPKGAPPKSLVVEELKKGSGMVAQTGDKVTIQFVEIHFNGEPFESSWKFGTPFRFQLGADKVSPGWEKGIPGMRVGGRRRLIVPWTLISHFGVLPESGPKDSQVFVLDLLDVG